MRHHRAGRKDNKYHEEIYVSQPSEISPQCLSSPFNMRGITRTLWEMLQINEQDCLMAILYFFFITLCINVIKYFDLSGI